MKFLKTVFAVSIAAFLLTACKPSEKTSVLPPGDAGHFGCQEQEIDRNGECVPASENNAELFGQNLDPFVVSSVIAQDNLGFLAKPKAPGIYPGVVMIHEWWGLNDNIKEMAKLLAKEGYVVLAVDLYNGQVAADSTQAMELVGGVRANPQPALEKLKRAVQYLRISEKAPKVGSLGWCFGGGQSLQLSLNDNLNATVIYYGQLTDDQTKLKNIRWPVLGIFGDKDTGIPVASVEAFKNSLDALNIQNQIIVYPGVGHAFANPSNSNYAKRETLDAWQKTVDFLKANLKSPVVSPAAAKPDLQTKKTFKLTAEPFKFMMNGAASPELRVKMGTLVRVELTTLKGLHDWALDEFNIITEKLTDGQSTSVEFTANRKGTFEYYCSVGNHRVMGMKGAFIVE